MAEADDTSHAPLGDADGMTREDLIRTAARGHERDRYLSALLSPAAIRDDLIALAAFVGDVSRIPIYVSEPMVGEIRLQWWRDTLQGGIATGASSGNPIADAIIAVARRHSLPIGLLESIVDAQILALYPDPPTDEMELRQHLGKLHGGAFALAARISDPEQARAQTDWIRDAGIAYGIARTALELPAIRAQSRDRVPATWRAERAAKPTIDPDARAPAAADATPADLHADADRLADVALQMFNQLARRQIRQPVSVRNACRPLAMVPPYCHAVRKLGRSARSTRDHEHLTIAADVSPLTRVWTLWLGRI
ncbi:MAG: squalene/phytoene synthase family protein [Pseudomonadota bacterium]